jgi:hypothetical protein
VSKEPTGEAAEAADWHRRFAIDLYNAAWTLLDSPNRTPDQDGDLLAAAFGSRWHWGQVGSDEQWAVGDWLLASTYEGMARAHGAAWRQSGTRRLVRACEDRELTASQLASVQ